ncbi:MAG TPA: hypothetical protein VJV79_33815 [Polyangiaceae bacterium]|nr:hypothetical protein [Polyangiaceae bacterium]
MNARPAWLFLVSVAGLSAFSLSCGGGSDDPKASAGAANGGSSGAGSGASAGGKPGAGTGGNGGSGVDCGALCGQVKALCAESSPVSEVWVDACESACGARVQLTPDVAQLEQTCVMAAAGCSAAVSCVASPH